MESSIRTARIAVYKLLNLNKQVPDINPSQYDIRHLLKAVRTLNDGKAFLGEVILHKVLRGTYFEHVLPPIEEDKEEHESFLPSKQTDLKIG